MAFATIDFPEPDCAVGPFWEGNAQFANAKDRFCSDIRHGELLAFAGKFRVKGVVESFAHQVEREHRQEDGQTGEEA